MLIEKPRCNFINCRYCFDGNCFSANKYENCKLTDLHCEIAKLTVDLDNANSEIETLKDNNEHLAVMYEKAKQEVAMEIFEEIENRAFGFGACFVEMTRTTFDELKKKYTGENHES